MSEIKKNIRMSEDGEHTDFVAALSITYNGVTRTVRYDLGELCDDNGQMTETDFDTAMRYLRTPVLAHFICNLKLIKD